LPWELELGFQLELEELDLGPLLREELAPLLREELEAEDRPEE
jgi:hypothetical protein